MKKIGIIFLLFSLNVYASYRPPNSDKYVDSFPSVFQKSHPTYQPAEQYHPNFPPDKPFAGSGAPEILAPERKATQKVPPGKMKGPPIPPPPEEQPPQNGQIPPNAPVQNNSSQNEMPHQTTNETVQNNSPQNSMPGTYQTTNETVQNDETLGRTAKPPPASYNYQGLSTPAPERAPKQIYPTNKPPPQTRRTQGKRPPPPSRPNPMELQHHGEMMTHPQPQKNPDTGRAIAPFPKFPRMD